uniref:RING-type E3 ubiquitin transferase n=2 Tax=Salix viminalis TaxID=40686 RepID=A0A6N2KKS6_SALVM
MAVSPQVFPPRKRRPSAGAFIPPKFSDQRLLQTLLELSQEISSLKPLQFLLKRNSSSILRKTKILAILFEELLKNPILFLSPTLLCFEEMYLVLQRIKTLLEDCVNGSKMWLLMQSDSVANNFHELTVELATLLDIFPVKEVGISEEVEELFLVLRKQCSTDKVCVDKRDYNLRHDVLTMIDRIQKEIVPNHSKLAVIFYLLGFSSSLSCKEEIENLEEEVQNQKDEKSKSDLIALIGLVRYVKCVLFETSTPASDTRRKSLASDVNVPADFRCPISLDLMRDPVVVATGQTYDRESISLWIESGHNTCPKTGQTLVHNNLIPNRALKNLIAMWCREQRILFETTEGNKRTNRVIKNKAALEADKMTVSFLVNKMSASRSMEEVDGVIYELRALAKTSSDSRACIAEAGAIPVLARFLGPDIGSEFPDLQVNAVTAMLNLSILEANKTRIMENGRAFNGVIEEKTGEEDTCCERIDGFSEKRAHELEERCIGRQPGRLIKEGVVDMINEVINEMPEEAAAMLEMVVKRGGIVAVAAAYNAIKKLGLLMREGSEIARESAAATLVTICRKGGADMVAELASIMGIERIIWELLGSGTMRARRKASILLRILRRWAAGLDDDFFYGHSTAATASSASSTTMVLPA